jgi:hypothetical protein
VIERELHDPAALAENVYNNMDETGILSSVLTSRKFLGSTDDVKKYKGAKRTQITAIECVSADGGCLNPLIIWPVLIHRSAWCGGTGSASNRRRDSVAEEDDDEDDEQDQNEGEQGEQQHRKPKPVEGHRVRIHRY